MLSFIGADFLNRGHRESLLAISSPRKPSQHQHHKNLPLRSLRLQHRTHQKNKSQQQINTAPIQIWTPSLNQGKKTLFKNLQNQSHCRRHHRRRNLDLPLSDFCCDSNFCPSCFLSSRDFGFGSRTHFSLIRRGFRRRGKGCIRRFGFRWTLRKFFQFLAQRLDLHFKRDYSTERFQRQLTD